jgi:hypothetical protein
LVENFGSLGRNYDVGQIKSLAKVRKEREREMITTLSKIDIIVFFQLLKGL